MNKRMRKKLDKAKELIFDVERKLREENSITAANHLYQSRKDVNSAINQVEFDEVHSQE